MLGKQSHILILYHTDTQKLVHCYVKENRNFGQKAYIGATQPGLTYLRI